MRSPETLPTHNPTHKECVKCIHKFLCTLENVLEVHFGLYTKNGEGALEEVSSRAGRGKKNWENNNIRISYLIKKEGCPAPRSGHQFKLIQHAQADHPLNLEQFLLG